MKRRRTIIRILIGIFLIYLLSYIGISFQGHYEPNAYGLKQGPNDTLIFAPKEALGYLWNPFHSDLMFLDDDSAKANYLQRIYQPLLITDRKLWHTTKDPKQVGTGDYRVKNFFDPTTQEYRDIEPD